MNRDKPFYNFAHEPITVEEFEELRQGEGYRVGEDWLNDYRVSTVFLFVDHNFGGGPVPILYETMVFDNAEGEDRYCERYATRQAALAGHDRVVAHMRHTGAPPAYGVDA